MTTSSRTSASSMSVLGIVELLLREARVLLTVAVVCGLVAGLVAFLTPRKFVSTASFIPEAGAEAGAGLAAAARQFGIGLGGASGTGWPPGLYVQVLSSQAMMVSVASDSVPSPSRTGARVALVDLFEMADGSAQVRAEKLVKVLRREVISVSESRLVGSVTIRVTTRWPQVSEAIARMMMQRVDAFNQQARLANAQAELEFIDRRVDSARVALASSESRLSSFLASNRIVNDPRLEFQKQKLERDVRFDEQLLLGLAQQREEARLRRARDVPSFSVVEQPRAPGVGEPRGTVARTIIGGSIGFLAAIAFVILRKSAQDAAAADPEATARLHAAWGRFLARR